MDKLAKLFLMKDNFPLMDRFWVMRMMFGGHIDKYDYHKVGLNREILEHFLSNAGFFNLKIVDDFGVFKDTSTMKCHDIPISINIVAEKPVSDSSLERNHDDKKSVPVLINSGICKNANMNNRRKGAMQQLPIAFRNQQKLLLNNKVLTIFDAGAHVGNTVANYKYLFPEATIYSFEPFPESIERLRKRFLGDSLVKPIQMAISNEAGAREFYVNNTFEQTNSLFPRPISARRYYPKGAELMNRIEVGVTTIDKFCSEESISNIQILKMDIQGGELMALQGASEMLHQGRIDLIYTEVLFVPHYEGAPMFYELCEYLSKWGYTLFGIYNLFLAKNGQLRFADAIFVSPHIRADVIDSFDPEV